MTNDNMLTALCLWEAMLDQRENIATLDRVWDQMGTWEMRQQAINLAPQFDDLWDKLNESLEAQKLDGMSFDWEFVPLLLPYVCWAGGCASGWTISDESVAQLVMTEHARLMGRS